MLILFTDHDIYHWYSGYIYTESKGCQIIVLVQSQMPELLKEMLKESTLKAVNSWRLWHSVHHCDCGLSMYFSCIF